MRFAYIKKIAPFIVLFSCYNLVLSNIKNEGLKQKIPFFTKNVGQWDSCILYKSNFQDIDLFFLNNSIIYSNTKYIENLKEEDAEKNYCYQNFSWKISFENSNRNPIIMESLKANSYSNYFIGKNKDRHKTGVPSYEKITYINLYKQIDLCYYLNNNQLEYDYIINPGAKINSIAMKFEGIKKLVINQKKELEVITEVGSWIEKKPYAYQVINGNKKEISVEFVLLNDTTFGFRADRKYNTSIPLIIDPVTLQWCTYIGGTGGAYGSIQNIKTNNLEEIYGICNYTNFFPTTTGSFNTIFSGGLADVAVFKLDPSATRLIYSTYYGGNNQDFPIALELKNNNAVVMGYTMSTNLATTSNCYSNALNGFGDYFVFELNEDGTLLEYGTYFGGSGFEQEGDMTIDTLGNIYCVGSTDSPDFPFTTGCFQSIINGNRDAVVFKIEPSGNGAADLLYSTYLGGDCFFEGEAGQAIAVNNAGEIFISGTTNCNNFPVTSNAIQTIIGGEEICGGPFCFYNSDAFIAQINPIGNGTADLIYSTFLGGENNEDGANGILINNQNEIFVSGTTSSFDFPKTTNAFDTTYNDSEQPGDLFISRIDPNVFGKSGLKYATFFGGNHNDFFPRNSILLDKHDNVWVAGYTNSIDFPTTQCSYDNFIESATGDIFLSKLSTINNTIIYSTFVQGNNHDHSPCIALSGDSCNFGLILAFNTKSTNIPTTTGVLQPSKLNTLTNYQPCILKFIPKASPGFNYSPNPACGEISFMDTTSSCGMWEQINEWEWDFGDGQKSTLKNPTHSYDSPQIYNVKLKIGCQKDSIEIPINVLSTPNLNISTNVSVCVGEEVTLSASGGGTYQWASSLLLSSTSGHIVTTEPTELGTFTFSVTGYSGTCEGSKIGIISVIPQVTVNSSSDIKLCSGDSSFVFVYGNGNTYNWNPSYGINKTTGDTIIAKPTKSTTYYISSSNGSCSATDSIKITVHKNNTKASNEKDKLILKGDSVQLNANSGNNYYWFPSNGLSCSNCQNPFAKPNFSTIYYIYSVDSLNCKSNTDSVKVIVNDYCGTVYIPNTFSPNRDGINDFWEIKGSCINRFELVIFNKWGEKIYHTYDIKEYWDGPKQTNYFDVYTYKLNVFFDNNANPMSTQGSISIIN